MSALGSLVVKLALEYAEYTKGLDKSSQEALKFAQNTQKHFDKANEVTHEFFTGVVKGAASAAAAYIGVSSAVDMFNESLDNLAGLDDMAQKTGASVENLSRLQKVAVMTGTEFGNVDSAIDKLAKNMANIDDESNKTFKALELLGVSSTDTAGKLRDPAEVLIDVAKGLQSYEDGAEKVAIANDLFGKSGAELIPYLNDVNENVDKFTGVSAEAAQKASEMQDRFGALKVQADELKTEFSMALLPAINGISEAIVDTYKESGKLEAAWVALGGLGAFLFTDDFDTDKQKLADLREELDALEIDLKLRQESYGANGALKRLLFGGYSMDELPKAIEYTRYQIELLQEKIKNDSAPKAGSKGNIDLGKSRAEEEAEKEAIARAERLKRDQESQIKQREKFVEGLEKEAATLSMTAAESKVYEAAQLGISGKQLEKVKTLVKSIEAHKANEKAIEDDLKISQEHAAQNLEFANSLQKNVDVLQAQVDAQREYNNRIGLSQVEINRLNDAEVERKAIALEGLATVMDQIDITGQLGDKYREEAKLLRELNALKNEGLDKQSGIDQLNQSLREQSDMWASIDRTAHDTFISMWDNGKDAAQRLKDTFKNVFFDWLYQMTVKKWIVNVSAGFSGSASASGGGSTDSSSMISAGKSLWDSFSSSSSIGGGIANVAGNYIGQFGSLIGSQAVSAFASGLSGTAVGTMAGSGATIAGSATGLGSMSAAAGMGEGFGVLAAGAEAGSAAGAAGMGAGISSALAAIPVWGWAALAAAAVAAKFGGGKDRVIGDQSISGTLGTNDINRNVNWTKDGGWFHSDTSGTWNYNLANSTAIASNGQAYQDSASVANDQALLKRLNDTYDSIKASSASFATALGLNAESIAKRSDTINFALGKTQEEIEKAIQSTFGSIADKIALDLMPSISQFTIEGEAASATLSRLATNFQTVNQGFDALGLKMFEMGQEGIKASEKFTAAVGGLQSFQAAQASFYQNFYSEEERNAELKKQLTAELQKQNLALPESRQGYRALLEEVSKTGTPEQLASLFKLNAAFASVFGEVDAAADLAATQFDQQVLSQQRLSAAAIAATQAIEQQVLATAALERATAQKAYDDALQGRLRSGKVGEIMSSNYALNPIDFGKYSANGGFDAGGFNSEIIRQRAKLAIDLANQASADAINVEDITSVLSSLFDFTKDREFENELRRSLPANARNQVSETVGYVFSDFIDASIAGIRLNQWTSRGNGITSVIAAQEDFQFQTDLQTGYSRSLSSANAMLRLGIITQEQYQAALSDANEILADNVRSQESLNDALRQAGIDSVSFYFDQIGKSVEALNAAAIEAQEPLAQVNASIGRLKSIGDVLSLSANAAGGDAKADLVARSAALAASALTTQSAAQIAKELAAKESFAGIDDPQLRNLSMLIEGVKSFDAGSFEAGFLRISDALNKGMINESQYQDLFDQSLSTFKGADQEVEALSNSMAKLRDSMSSFADSLMVDKQRTALSSIESFAALQSQYDTAKMLAATGDSAAVSRFQSLATQLLDRDDYKTRGDYNAQFSRVLGDARYLETIGARSVQNDGQNIVDELVKMNADLTKELTKLREEMRVSMGAIANNTSKTASGVGTLVTQG